MQKSKKEEADESRELLRSILRFMKEKQGLNLNELVGIYSALTPEESVPVSIFSQRLSPSEALCKYLHEERKLNFHEISAIINRDERSVWTSCRRAARKMPKRLEAKESDISIPLTEFTDRSRSILEHVVTYMNTKHRLSNREIAKMLNKQQGAIATVANRAKEKAR